MTARRAALTLAFLLLAPRIDAQTRSSSSDSSRKWEITDNSFLVEEAFNQEPGVVQNIFSWIRGRDGAWDANFTQEWPAPGMLHQLSYTLMYASTGDATGFGDTLLNYRFQLRNETAGGPAISPRLSVILPTGREADGLGGGSAGLQVNVPVSKQFGDFYVHANVGHTWVHDVQQTTNAAASGIWRVAPMLNLMLEAVVEIDESATLSPGFRRGWNVGDRQLVVGLAMPVTHADRRWSPALLTYFSYELPFR
ncbi:MAG: hypothetical protein JWL71_785 [Acidobacteria bacterium]|nr:hypothetical protein [Acidobacteriota bacterium]